MAQPDPTAVQPWRAAAIDAMRDACQHEAAQRNGHRTPFNYRWEHVQAVVTTACKLAELTGADREVVEAAAWLHDIRKDAGESHPQAGAAYARQFLPQTDFPPHKIEAVAAAIEQHMGLWRDEPLTELTAQVLWDADKLTKIGPMAWVHWAGRYLSADRPATTPHFIDNARSQTWRAKTVASMHTEPARRAAAARFAAYEALWDEIAAEWSAADLTAAA